MRHALGAFVLGHLDEREATAVRAHLDGCGECRREAAELEVVADLLPLADPERLGVVAHPPRRMLDDVLARIRQERRSSDRVRRRTMVARLGAVAAALAVVLVAGLVVWPTSDAPSGEIVALTASRRGVVGEAVIHEDPRATWVELTTSGLTAGETYAVWLEESETGQRAPLGTFTGVEGDLYISLYSTLPRDRAIAIGVSAPDGSTVLEGAIPVPVTS